MHWPCCACRISTPALALCRYSRTLHTSPLALFRLTIYTSDIRNEFRVGRSTGNSERNSTLTAAHSRNLGYASYRSTLRFASILKLSARRMAEFSAEWLLMTFLTADASAG
jgi:hypothetical protein